MRPHEIPAEFKGRCERRLLRVVDGMTFAFGDLDPSKCAWLISAPESGVPDLPWGAVLVVPSEAARHDRHNEMTHSGTLEWQSNCPLVCLMQIAAVVAGDIVELLPEKNRVRTRYHRGANANTLFATERCNSYCLMCSQPPRAVDDGWRIQDMLDVISLLDRNVPELGISGGEPTLLGEGLVQVLRACRDRLPDTPIHVLSNGRLFGKTALAESVAAVQHPLLTWGIPLYADVASVHDYVVQSAGAFDETLRGLLVMASKGLAVEIRVVLTAPTVKRLPKLAEFIYRHLPFTIHVAFMGLEPIGFALANRETLWLDPADMAPPLTEAVNHLANRGMAVSLYNLPLCVLPVTLRPFARRSISDWKQRYLDVCERCAGRSQCAGFFEWVKPGWIPCGLNPLNEMEAAEI